MNIYSTARSYFPRGLSQPEGSFRFAEDALLLAAFALRECAPDSAAGAMVDLGCGCGVIGLACLLAEKGWSCLGVDVSAELVDAATANAALLSLGGRYLARVVDFADNEAIEALPRKSCSLAVANMPYRALGSGRLPQSEIRRRALFADDKTLDSFMRAARHVVAPGGTLALVYPWDARAALLEAATRHGFSPRTLLPVNTADGRTTRVLVRVDACSARLAVQEAPPLVLRAEGSKEYTQEAETFCPWLLCRPWGTAAHF